MSETNALRYEIIQNKSGLHSALKRQQRQIQSDELTAAREGQAKIEARVNQRSDWMESLDRMAGVQRAKKEHVQNKAEIKLLQKASIMVRRAQLQELLENEYKAYEAELNGQGKAFYVNRT